MSGGLEGVVAADTALSHTDGGTGVLWVRGRTVAELVADEGYEGTLALLWNGLAGDGFTRDGMRAALGAARQKAFARRDGWLDAAARHPVLEGIRVALAALPEDSTPAEIAATFPVALATLLRLRDGHEPVAPDPALSTAADLLRMTKGAPVEDRFATALDTYFTTVCENGLGTSSFAARVVISTRASLASAVLGAYCAFTGPLHGGAPGPALDMLDAIAASGDIDGWIERTLAGGGRLMGFGHRVYRIRDPRADVLRGAVERLGADAGRLAFASQVERAALAALARHKPGRVLQSNIEMNAGLLLDAVGFPRDAFTAVFSTARCGGWIAHALEQRQTGRMIRPTSHYTGLRPA